MFPRLFAIALFALVVTASPARAEGFASRYVTLDPPQPAPAVAFEDERGQSVSLADFRGRYVVVNLWATWCVPCVNEIPALSELQNQFVLQRLTVIAFAEDASGVSTVKAFYATHHIHHLTIYDDPTGRAPALFHARGLPMSYVIDPEGREIGRVEGDADWGSPDAVAFLEAHMHLWH